jgi:hypothetical protein
LLLEEVQPFSEPAAQSRLVSFPALDPVQGTQQTFIAVGRIDRAMNFNDDCAVNLSFATQSSFHPNPPAANIL